ncbi:protein TESPA1 [Chamaea fasciata]|uniref:protein TESPA1 n=1 Tax=Chamaea fasciata TaxID=190680 RepID=UPI00336A9695
MTSGVPPGVPPRCPHGLQVLSWWHRDAEEILHDLGFVGTEPGVASRVPPRFFSAPSRASGIDLRLFVRAQARRLRMEDPCLLLAGRFQQLQALATSADAFFCLYHYVSRTPPQRSSPPRPCRDMPDMAPPGPCPKRAGGSGLGSRCHPRVTATAGGHRGGPPGVSSGLAPPGAAESFEMEEVLSGEEEEDGDSDDDDEGEDEDEDEGAALSPHPSVRTRRSSLFHGRSDSSGFGEEPLPASSPHCPHWVT